MKTAKFTKTLFAILFSLFSIPASSQQITQLGSWSNNANFSVHYFNERVITSTSSGITFLNVSNPAIPVPAGSLGNPGGGFATAVNVDGNYAYFGGGMVNYFMIADISNLNFPVQAGITHNIHGTGYQIAFKDNHAFMPTNSDTLYAINISNKTAPVVAGKLNLGSFSAGIAIKGNYAYVGTSGGLKVVDITNPANMSIVNSFGGGYYKVAADLPANRLFVAKNGTGFDVIDISNPTNPAPLFQGIGGSSEGDLVFKNGYIFQISSANVSAFQIGSSSATHLASFNQTITGQVTGVTAKDSVFYVSTVNHVHVLKLGSVVTGIKKFELAPDFTCYPNPAKDKITISTGKYASGSSLVIRNYLGQAVISLRNLTSETVEADISELNSGMYFITGSGFDGRPVMRFIKE